MKSTGVSCRGVHDPVEGTIERKAMGGAFLLFRSITGSTRAEVRQVEVSATESGYARSGLRCKEAA